MLYRKTPARPPQLLLRIVATAGAGALLGAAACSSSSNGGSSGVLGVVPLNTGDDAAAEASTIITGVMPNHPDGGPCGGGPCGVVALPRDDGSAGDANAADGDMLTDAPADADNVPCCVGDGGICICPDR